MAILTFEQQQAIKPISVNNEDDYTQLEKEVEDYELSKLLGYAFFQDVSENPTNYVDLLDGCSFEDIRGITVNHVGLRKVLAYLVYSKYVGSSFVKDTFTGFVQKTRQDSETIGEGTRKRLMQESYEIAMNYFELIKMYIELNNDTYPLWSCVGSGRKVFVHKFYGLKNI